MIVWQSSEGRLPSQTLICREIGTVTKKSCQIGNEGAKRSIKRPFASRLQNWLVRSSAQVQREGSENRADGDYSQPAAKRGQREPPRSGPARD
ncbi:MAG: hypothetical protein KDA91_19055 [Planctomycetaceae bacterium]|nr:hypothetical protein [Planctomycetaceae bacterium]